MDESIRDGEAGNEERHERRNEGTRKKRHGEKEVSLQELGKREGRKERWN